MVEQSREQYVQYYSDAYRVAGVGVAGVGLGNKVTYLQKAGYREGMSFLDYGCGWGAILQGINPTQYLGVDMAPPAVEEAQRRFPDKHFKVVEIGKLGITATYDFVAAISVFTHTPYADADDSLEDIYQAMKPGGLGMVDILEGERGQETEFIRYWRKEDFVQKLKQHGFEVADTFKTIGNYEFQHTFFAIRKPVKAMPSPWVYLNTEPFAMRYKLAAAYLEGQTSDKIIVDINCGEPGFYQALPKDFKAYFCNDINPIAMTGEKLHFSRITDIQVDIKPDILAIFGYGGGEYTGQPLESATAGETVIRLANKYRPEFIVIEMAVKWETDFNALGNILAKIPEYLVGLQSIVNIFPLDHYHNQRLLTVLRRNQDG